MPLMLKSALAALALTIVPGCAALLAFPEIRSLEGPFGCAEGDMVVDETVRTYSQTGEFISYESFQSCEGPRGGYHPGVFGKLLVVGLFAFFALWATCTAFLQRRGHA